MHVDAKTYDPAGIAIVGMACRFPGAPHLERFWHNVRDGVESVTFLTASDLEATGIEPRQLHDPHYVRAAAMLDQADHFDAGFFGYSPREAMLTDPQHRVFLELAWEALEHAGYDPGRYRGAIGVYAGVGTNAYLLHNLAANPDLLAAAGPLETLIGNEKDFVATRVSYELNLHGPSLNVQTACSSSLVAVCLAFQALMTYQCDMALAGGVSIRFPQRVGYQYEPDGIFSPDGHTRPFDAAARGTVFGDGAGLVVLKRLADAVADGDHIWAVIRGAALNNDGGLKAGYSAPSIEGQMEVITTAQTLAQVEPDTISYIEAHGTGTALGDLVEIEALTQAFRTSTARTQFCAVGSVKGNFGHLDRAAGISGLIKTVLALYHGYLPPSLNVDTLNPRIDFEASPFYVNDTLAVWERHGHPRRAGVSSFGIGGTNAHVVLEEGPPLTSIPKSPRRAHLLLLSAQASHTLETLTDQWVDYGRQHPELYIADAAYTLQVGRKPFSHRRMLVAHDWHEAVQSLASRDPECMWTSTAADVAPKLVFVFPPAEALTVVVTDDAIALWCATEPAFRQHWHALAGATWRTPRARVLRWQVAMANLLRAWGISASRVVGQGTGELAAACWRNEVTLEAALSHLSNLDERPPGETEVQVAADECLLIFGTAESVSATAAAPVHDPSVALCASDPAAHSDALMMALGRLWLLGIEPDWQVVHADVPARRVPLPTYPFDRQRYVIEAPPPRPTPTTIPEVMPQQEERDISNWFYLPVWKSSMAPSTPTAALRTRKRWLVFADATGVATSLIQRLRTADQDVVMVLPDEVGDDVFAGAATLNPDSPEAVAAFIRELAPAVPDVVVYLWTLSAPADAEQSMEALRPRYFDCLLYAIRGLGEQAANRAIRLLVVSDNLYDVIGEPSLDPRRAVLLGPVRVSREEYPDLCCCHVDIDRASKRARDAMHGVDQIVAEALHHGADAVVAYRHQRRWVQHLEPVSLPPAEPTLLRPGGTYLITGGLGLVGLTFATYLARKVQANLALVSRSGLPPRDTWPDLLAQVSDDVAPVAVHPRMETLDLTVADVASTTLFQTVSQLPELEANLYRYCAALIYTLFADQGVDTRPGHAISKADLRDQFQVVSRSDRLFHMLCTILAQQDLLRDEGETLTWLRAPSALPALDQLHRGLQHAYPQFGPFLDFLWHCARHYAAILRGEQDGVSVLFPEGETRLMEAFYATMETYSSSGLYTRVVAKMAADMAASTRTWPLKILEIGAGTGTLTRHVAPALAGGHVEYHFTDIGPLFVNRGAAQAAEQGWDFMRFGVLDIASDPVAQGYVEGDFDLIIGANVVHATADVTQTLHHLQRLLAPGGLLMFIELMHPYPWVQMISGCLDGWWQFDDLYRTESPLMPLEAWEQGLVRVGFRHVAALPRDAGQRATFDCGLLVAGTDADPLEAQSPDTPRRHSDRQLKRIRAVQALERLGSQVLPICADVTDAAQMRAALSHVHERFGPVHGVLHSAGVVHQGLMQQKAMTEAVQVLAPKVTGTLVLDELLRDQPLDFLLLCSSASAVMPLVGDVDYCAANAFLDAYAHSKVATGETRVVSINWGVWRDEGMAEDSNVRYMLERLWDTHGLRWGISSTAAMEVVDRILGGCTSPQIAVSTVDLLNGIRWLNTFFKGQGPGGTTSSTVTGSVHARPELSTLYVAPTTAAQQSMAELWQALFAVDRVGVHDNFFELGGDSLLGIKLLSDIRERFERDLPIQTLFECTTVAELTERLEMPASDGPAPPSDIIPVLPRVTPQGAPQTRFAASVAQASMWFMEQSQPGNPFYNIPRVLRLADAFDPEVCRRALEEITRRHEVLRTTFVVMDHQPFQAIAPVVPIDLPIVDLRHLTREAQHAEVERLTTADALAPFDLHHGPLWRATLLRLAADTHHLIVNLHHLIADGWSVGIFVRELAVLYKAFAHGRLSPLEPLPVQYADYASWHNQRLQEADMQAKLAYWQQELAGAPALHRLPLNDARPEVPSQRGEHLFFDLDREATDALSTCSRQWGVTPYMVLLAVFKLVLYRYSGADELLVGTPMLNRPLKELHDLIGYFANIVVTRTFISPKDTFRQLLAQVKAKILAAQAHQEIPLARIVEAVQPPRVANHHPLFQIFFNYLDEPMGTLKLPGIDMVPVFPRQGQTDFDLFMGFIEDHDGLHGSLCYRSDLFALHMVEGWLDTYQHLLREVLQHVDLAVHAPPAPRLDVPRLYTALMQYDTVEDCAVICRDTQTGDPEAVAYVVPNGPWAPEKLQAYLQAHLAGESLPIAYVPVGRIPLQADGRLDVQILQTIPVIDASVVQQWESRLHALPEVDEVAVIVQERALPSTPLHLADLLPAARVAETLPDPNPPVPSVSSSPPPPLPLAISHGAPYVDDPAAPQILPELLQRAARTGVPEAMIFLQADGSEVAVSYEGLLEQAQHVLGGLRQCGLQPGQAVIFQLASNLEVVAAFWGCVLGGFVPVPTAVPPTYREQNATVMRLMNAWELLEEPLVCASPGFVSELQDMAVRLGRAMRIASMADVAQASMDTTWHPSRHEDPALLLLTSGSTGVPKAVTLTHRMLLLRSAIAGAYNGCQARDVSLNCFSLEHIGGLVMFHVHDVALGCRQVHVPTPLLLHDPLHWLDWIERYRVTRTWAPNFLFGLVNIRMDEMAGRRWNLSSVRHIINAAEPIVSKTARRFLTLLQPHGLSPAAMRPSWGMTETTSAVTFNMDFNLATSADTDAFVDLGAPMPGISCRVVDAKQQIVPEGTIGALQVKGVTVTPGYYRNLEKNAEDFDAEGWFHTGDLAFLQHGRLFVTGREKDVIIIHGINYVGHEIEAMVKEVDGVSSTSVGACAVRDRDSETDQLAIFFSPTDATETLPLETIHAIRHTVTHMIGLQPAYVIPIPPADFPHIGVGKIQRSALVQRFAAGDFDAILQQIDVASGNRRTLPPWFFQTIWGAKQLPLQGELPPQGCYLVLADAAGLGEALLQMLHAPDCTSILVQPGASWQQVSAYHYLINPGAPTQYQQLLRAVHASGHTVRYVVHLWTYDETLSLPQTPADLEATQSRGCYSLLWLTQALTAVHQGSDPVHLVLGGSYTQGLPGDPAIDYAKAPILGLVRTLPREIPWLHCRHVDLEPDTVTPNAHRLLHEIADPGHDAEVAYRHDLRMVPGLEPIDFRQQRRRELPFRPGGCYLITGGLGGLGYRLATYLIEHYQARLLLIGRHRVNPAATGVDDPAQRLHRLMQRSHTVWYEAVDVAEADRLQQVVSDAEQQWQASLDGIFHLAGVYREQALQEESRDGLAATLRPKLSGAWALHQLTRERPHLFTLHFSSVLGVFGGAMVGAYAAANRALNAFAFHQRCDGAPRSWCLTWSVWEGMGMGQGYEGLTALTAKGYQRIAPERGLQSLRIALHHDLEQVLIGLDPNKAYLRSQVRTAEVATQELVAYVTAPVPIAVDDPGGIEIADRFGTPCRLRLVQLDHLPRTPDGHIERGMLRRDGGSGHTRRTAVIVPRNEVERLIARIWQEVLQVDTVGVDDNFFDLGGHSILAIQVYSRLQDAFGQQIAMMDLLQYPTIAGLATYLRQSQPDREALHQGETRANTRRALQQRQWRLRQRQSSPPSKDTAS